MRVLIKARNTSEQAIKISKQSKDKTIEKGGMMTH